MASNRENHPLTTPGGGEYLEYQESIREGFTTTPTTTTRACVEVCAGPDWETLGHRHTTSDALVRHLEIFLAHRNAQALLDSYGKDCVVQALVELDYELQNDGEIRRPAAFLTWRAKKLAQGARPMCPPDEKPKQPRLERRIAELRHGS